MSCKIKAKLLNENLKVIDNIKVSFEPKTQSISFYDEDLANSMFKIESTEMAFVNKNDNIDISDYIYVNKTLYKIIKLSKYSSYVECLVYKCNNIFVNINDIDLNDKKMEEYKSKSINSFNILNTPQTFRTANSTSNYNDEIIIIKYEAK